ncbi:hypothetical protein CDV36_014476 [Fusarium kuroshium]|uniref:Alcohol dehydrogenase-like C-terminal domain-containing protein n=1 Tax=Fusarium kuroshium TaxID=2010991 RepID=A0A3M2RHP5_9HYPO|nr:hypothetical protein CDV36_014476 [Fusarium kuroshium]
MGGTPPWTMGHEAVGYISDVGSAVSSLAVGDYVVISDSQSHGELDLKPEPQTYFGFGLPDVLDGLQAEYARVQLADQSLIPIPLTHETTNTAIEQDYLTLSDIFATGWASLDFAGFQPGDSVAVFGSGPVGLLAAYSALLRGASRVYAVDHIQSRLDRAASIGAIPINFRDQDPVAQILALEPDGVMRSVECVGMEALNSHLKKESDITIKQMVAVTHYGGGIGYIGVFKAHVDSPGAPLGSSIAPDITFPMSDFWEKSLSLRAGGVDPREYASILLDLIESGKAHPSFIGSAVVEIDDVPSYYASFNRGEEVKVFIHFP